MIEYIEWTIANPVSAFLLLLAEYIAIMLLSRQKRWSGIAKIATVPFIVQNCIVNLAVLTALFLDLPKEMLVTARMKRWKLYQARDRRQFIRRARYEFAWWLCGILNKFDEGHC